MPVVSKWTLVRYQPEVAFALKRDQMVYCACLVGMWLLVTARLAALMPFAAHSPLAFSQQLPSAQSVPQDPHCGA
jgi:hypothetical protein